MNSAHDIIWRNLYREETLSGKDYIDHTTAVHDFGQLYEDNFNRVFHYISYRIHDSAVVADLTSVVFEKALNAFHRYDKEKAEPQTWLMAIARNTVIDYFRQSARRNTQPLDTAVGLESIDPSPQEQTERNEEHEILRICYTLLPDREQEIVSLKFGSELTNRRIATVLSLSENNVGIILFRAIRKLRDCFEEWLNGRK